VQRTCPDGRGGGVVVEYQVRQRERERERRKREEARLGLTFHILEVYIPASVLSAAYLQSRGLV
jgi:hypothetical protein